MTDQDGAIPPLEPRGRRQVARLVDEIDEGSALLAERGSELFEVEVHQPTPTNQHASPLLVGASLLGFVVRHPGDTGHVHTAMRSSVRRMVESINPMAARAQVLEPLFAAQRMLALIEGAETTGVLSALADGATVEQVADQSGQSLAAVHAIVAALRSGEVVEAHGNGFRLTAPWAAVRSEASFFSFPVALAGDRIKAGQLRRVAEDDSYWTSSPDEQIAMAAAVSPDPVAGGFIHIIKQHLADGHPYALAVRDAASVLELGCGLAGAALSQLRVYPDLRVVGVEISEHLAAEAVRRAEMVGVADRFTMVVGDAVDYREDRDFDVGFWSQFFFATDKRQAAMEVLFDHVRSGGTVAAPGRWFDLETDPTGPIAQDYLLFRVLAQASDVPERDPAQLIAELESAGFTDPKVTRGGPSQFMVVVTRP